jgi:protein TonB
MRADALAKPAVGLLAMAFGVTLVLQGLVWMNGAPAREPEATKKEATSFARAPKPPPKKKQRPKPKPRKRAKAPRRAAPAPPSAAGGFSSPGFAMPGFDVGAVGADPDAMLGEVKAGVMTQDAVDERPRPTRRAAAPYPPRARAAGTEGFVQFSLLVDERGAIERVKLLEASPPGVFDQVAREAIQQWSFSPATYKGQAVKVWVKQKIVFKLS